MSKPTQPCEKESESVAGEGEEALITWLRERQRALGEVSLIGDDAAVLPTSEAWAVTMDTQLEGVHFHADMDPADVAHRLLAVNVSDLAAMGALPSFAFLALAAPRAFRTRRFLSAVTEGCRDYGMRLAGGDLTRGERVSAVLTLLGSKPSGQRWLRRGGARAGEILWVGGTLGEAAVGLQLLEAGARCIEGELQRPVPEPLPEPLPEALATAAKDAIERQRRPRPQLELGQWLGQQVDGGAMDISDGLAKDLHRMCLESDVGAVVQGDALPQAPLHDDLCRHLGVDPRRLMLTGGEDYVLLFSLPKGLEPPPSMACRAIGEIRRSPGVFLRQGGREIRLEAAGWDHLTA